MATIREVSQRQKQERTARAVHNVRQAVWNLHSTSDSYDLIIPLRARRQAESSTTGFGQDSQLYNED
ncbi:MAG: hypothetical protein IIC24_07005 [Chloroflexi bacterium]|nr:hypothetical protein [Chloroflexota bacterium]